MHSYADSSFLLSLYIPDGNHAKALAALPALRKTLSPLTPFHRLELRNGLSRKVFQGLLTSAEVNVVWATIESDGQIFGGGQAIDWGPVMPEAERLSATHTPHLGTRSLDIIHVVVALSLGAREFISLDPKQCALAARVGLSVLP